MAKPEKSDPTVTSRPSGEEYPEGTHPAVPVEQGDDAAASKTYVDNPDAGATAIAQLEVREDEK